MARRRVHNRRQAVKEDNRGETLNKTYHNLGAHAARVRRLPECVHAGQVTASASVRTRAACAPRIRSCYVVPARTLFAAWLELFGLDWLADCASHSPDER